MPFTEKAKQLLILERHAMPEWPHHPQPPLLRGAGGVMCVWDTENTDRAFGNSKSHGGLFKELINDVDDMLYSLIKQRWHYIIPIDLIIFSLPSHQTKSLRGLNQSHDALCSEEGLSFQLIRDRRQVLSCNSSG